LASCQKQSSNDGSDPAISEQQDTSEVLAVVNGEDITEADVEFMIDRTFSNVDRMFDSAQLREKVLQSLVASKAMRQSMHKTLGSEELTEIKRKSDAYTEELYVKAYLTENATPEPVTTDMVNDYYSRNPEQFGGAEIKSIEILKAKTKLAEKQRESLLSSLPTIKQTKDWQNFAKASELGLSYLRVKVQPGLLDSALEIAAKKLDIGKTSDVIFIKGLPNVIRAIKTETVAPKPLSSVSGSIRKKLAALQLKKAVKKASDEVIKSATVEFKK